MQSLNPDLWFNNVEVVVGERIGSEILTSFKHYIACKLVTEEEEERRQARAAVKKALQ